MSDVRDFGASGDGTTDDTEAIRHAVTKGMDTSSFPKATTASVAPSNYHSEHRDLELSSENPVVPASTCTPLDRHSAC